ncbi:uncharacterized protein LOC122250165 [Penaeus japonicus]|uniref:uncharacterized protein LOC122250165 n=1 Tax=Penaeus japonicus TaxID=27405 RepID=UPI001C714AF4|nr:uncharacterized protein LOC122250165 [Penaeus japonicus]
MASQSVFRMTRMAVLLLLVGYARSSPLQCREEGRFPHPDSCGSYVDCLPGPGDEMVAREGDCHGFPFSPALRRCVSHEEYPECVTKAARIAFPLSDFDYLCAEGASVGCVHCRLAYECIDDKAYIDPCQAGDTCSDYPLFGGGACLPYNYTLGKSSKCDCSQIGTTPDSYNTTYYLYCDPNSAPEVVEVFTCKEGKTYSNVTNTCESAACSEEPPVPACNGQTGTFVNPNQCSWYYTCLPDGTSRSSCCGDAKQYFNENSKACEDACALASSTAPANPCDGSTEGKVADPSDCTKFVFCDNGSTEPIKTQSCPSGTYFDTSSCVVGECPNPSIYSTCPGFADLGC